jgi:hypothetical protein
LKTFVNKSINRSFPVYGKLYCTSLQRFKPLHGIKSINFCNTKNLRFIFLLFLNLYFRNFSLISTVVIHSVFDNIVINLGSNDSYNFKCQEIDDDHVFPSELSQIFTTTHLFSISYRYEFASIVTTIRRYH